MKSDFSKIRREYLQKELNEVDVNSDPVLQFEKWFNEAVEYGIDLPNAMALATVTSDSKPACRYVLLKQFDNSGFVFYTHSDSAKGIQLAQNKSAALVFYWSPMDRQIRIEGNVDVVTVEEANDYFNSRPYGSRVSACVARQSSVVSNRESLESRMKELEDKYPDEDIPMPESWTGYRLTAINMEFWQGRENRLHDRILYTRCPDNNWTIQRLAP